MHDLTMRFTEALDVLHAERDADQLVALFTDDATLSKLGVGRHERGKDGARSFWQEYRDVFDDIDVAFSHVVEGPDSVALEWTCTGTLVGGAPLRYDGVSVLEGDADAITEFRTYYDSAAFLAESQRR